MKKWQKALSAFIVASVMCVGVGAAVGCNKKHTHSYKDDWFNGGAEGHWHESNCGHEHSKAEPHVDEDENGICDLCEYVYPSQEEHTTHDGWTWKDDGSTHHEETTCESHDPIKRNEGQNHVDELDNATKEAGHDGKCDLCDHVIYDPSTHTSHTYDETEWKKDATGHWRMTNCEEHDAIAGEVEDHVGVEADGKCDVCEWVDPNWTEPTLFEKLRDRSDNLVAEDFSDETVPGAFSGTYGTAGVYVEEGAVTGRSNIESGALVLGSSTKENDNVSAVIDFGLVKDTVEGYFEFTMSGNEPGSANGNYNNVNFVNGSTTVLQLMARKGNNFAISLNGSTVTPENEIASAMDTLYKVHFKFDLTNKKVTLVVNDKTVLNNVDSNIDSISGIKISTSDGGRRYNTVDNIAVCGTPMTAADYRPIVQAEIDKAYKAMVGDSEADPVVVGTHERNKAEIKDAYDAIDLTALTTISDLQAKVAEFKALATSIDSDAKIEAAIDAFKAELEGMAGNYKINKGGDNGFDALVAKYEALADAAKAVSTVTALNYSEDLAAIDNDATVIANYAKTKEDEIKDHGNLEGLTDTQKQAIADLKTSLIAGLTEGVRAEGKDYANSESADYYQTVINGKVDAAKTSITNKIAEYLESAGKSAEELRDAAQQKYDEFISDYLENNVLDTAYAAELKADEDNEAPKLEIDDLEDVTEIDEALEAAKEEYKKWVADKLAEKTYDVTVQGMLNGTANGKAVKITVKYGDPLAVADLPDPTAGINNLMIDPEDGKYYTTDALSADNVFAALANVYANQNLYVKLVLATMSEKKTNSFVFAELDSSESNYNLTEFKGESNAFLTKGSGTVQWRTDKEKSSTGEEVGMIQCENDVFSVTFDGPGTLTLELRGAGKSKIAPISLKSTTGVYAELDAASIALADVTALDNHIYGVASSDGNGKHTAVTFVIEVAGTYTLRVCKNDTLTVNGDTYNPGVDISQARISKIEKVENPRKVPATVKSIESVSLENASIAAGKSAQLKLTVNPEDAGYTAEWSVENDQTDGKITVKDGVVSVAEGAVAGKTATIKVEVTDGNGGKKDTTCTVTVAAAAQTWTTSNISLAEGKKSVIGPSDVISITSESELNIVDSTAQETFGVVEIGGTSYNSGLVCNKNVTFTAKNAAKVTVYFTVTDSKGALKNSKATSDVESDGGLTEFTTNKVVVEAVFTLSADGSFTLTPDGSNRLTIYKIVIE